jgi:hypothetical protein
MMWFFVVLNKYQLAKILYIVELDTAKAHAFVAQHADKLSDCKVLHPDDKATALADPLVQVSLLLLITFQIFDSNKSWFILGCHVCQ